MAQSKTIRIVEVGLRDGLQNEKTILSVLQKIECWVAIPGSLEKG